MGMCNWCHWQRMKKKGYKIATREEAKKAWKSSDDFNKAFGHGVTILDADGNFACWFMELPERCCC